MDINNLWSGYDLNTKKQNTRCLAINTILEGKYLVGPVLGQGGFGITYVGYDLNMEAKIAIKEYFPVELVSRDTTTMHGDRVLSLSGEKSVTYKAGLKKYVAEAQNVSQFSEIPGVVSVKDFFYANETAYIVMEYIDGISLKDYLKEKGGRLSEGETLAIMKPVLEALVQVHKSGIIHRDISPDNIMLTFEGSGHSKIKSVKLIDFGAARMTAKNDQKSLTIILKHGYAPEEQYRTHGKQGPWTDVYALCAVLYRMMTGETPVPAMDRMFKDELKSLEQYGVKVSANTAAAILKGLAVKKDDRIQNVQELIAALYEGAKVRAAAKEKSNKTPWIAGAGAAALAACALAVVLLGNGSDENVVSNVESSTVQTVVTENTQNDQAVTETAEMSEAETMALVEQEEVIGEQIAFYHPQNSMSVSENYGNHMLICKPDGTVEARGTNLMGQCNVDDWSNIVSVKAGANHSIGLRSDGIVEACGSNLYGQCDVSHWKDVVSICAGSTFSIGITKEGDVLSAGKLGSSHIRDYSGEDVWEDVSSWKNIKSIAYNNSFAIAGLTNDGTLKIAGTDVCQKLDGWESIEHIWFCGARVIGMDAEGEIKSADVLSQEDAERLIAGYSASSSENYADYAFDKLPNMKHVRVTYADGVDVDGKLVENVIQHENGAKVVYSDFPEEVEGWNELISVEFSQENNVVYGLKENGTLLEFMNNEGNAELDEFKNLEWVQVLGDGANEHFGLAARTKDQKNLYYGTTKNFTEWIRSDKKAIHVTEVSCLFDDGTLMDGYYEIEFPAENVKQIVALSSYRVNWILMDDGTIQYVAPGYEEELDPEIGKTIAGWKDIVQIAAISGSKLYGLKSDGTVVACYQAPPVLEDVKEIHCLGSRWAALKKDGTVVPMWNAEDDATGAYMAETWTDIETLSLGESHIVGLKPDGTVVAAGSNHVGQCDVEEWKDVVMIDAGINCTVGLTKDGELLVAGRLQ